MGIPAGNKEGVAATQFERRAALHSQQGAAVAHKMELRLARRLMERDAKRRAGFDSPIFHT